jgi:hypothetical protein
MGEVHGAEGAQIVRTLTFVSNSFMDGGITQLFLIIFLIVSPRQYDLVLKY